MIVDRCPGCASDELSLYSEPDGNEYGTWTRYWFECEACLKRLEARLVEGEYLPVADDDEVPV